ncbi:hypothetical protein B0A48_01453 [Cryoendolithus antarcticus]|uniref:Uncharacterized protein n=1 Tax=Cryoendolithus antarcticus TaxID=1507870 RepID=A0A1V8TPF0_9PEZI|nr:hypothetical protein B0A48_01453 [Cryoendolithus antarcticus]
MASSSEPSDFPAGITSALDQYYYLRFRAMMKLNDEDEEKAFDVARELHRDPELPLLYIARCHMILSCDEADAFFLQHAQEAVRVVNEDCRAVVKENDFPQDQYEEALRLLDEAKAEAVEKARLRDEELASIAEDEAVDGKGSGEVDVAGVVAGVADEGSRSKEV